MSQNKATEFSEQYLENWNIDTTVNPPVMVRGVMVKQGGSWVYWDGTMSYSPATVNEVYSGVTTLTSAGLATQITSSYLQTTDISIKAEYANVSAISIGPSTIVQGSGRSLDPGDSIDLTFSDLTGLYIVGYNATDKVTWLATK